MVRSSAHAETYWWPRILMIDVLMQPNNDTNSIFILPYLIKCSVLSCQFRLFPMLSIFLICIDIYCLYYIYRNKIIINYHKFILISCETKTTFLVQKNRSRSDHITKYNKIILNAVVHRVFTYILIYAAVIGYLHANILPHTPCIAFTLVLLS